MAHIEKITKNTWEKAIQKHLFKPLGIKSVGFGAPEGRNAIRGHRNGEPVGTGFLGDNPTQYGPAGGMHLNLSEQTGFCIIFNTGNPIAVPWIRKISTALQPAKK